MGQLFSVHRIVSFTLQFEHVCVCWYIFFFATQNTLHSTHSEHWFYETLQTMHCASRLSQSAHIGRSNGQYRDFPMERCTKPKTKTITPTGHQRYWRHSVCQSGWQTGTRTLSIGAQTNTRLLYLSILCLTARQPYRRIVLPGDATSGEGSWNGTVMQPRVINDHHNPRTPICRGSLYTLIKSEAHGKRHSSHTTTTVLLHSSAPCARVCL